MHQKDVCGTEVCSQEIVPGLRHTHARLPLVVLCSPGRVCRRSLNDYYVDLLQDFDGEMVLNKLLCVYARLALKLRGGFRECTGQRLQSHGQCGIRRTSCKIFSPRLFIFCARGASQASRVS